MSENDAEFGKIIAKAWRDPVFKAELIANPVAALKAEGIDVPAGMAVTVVENTDKQFHLVLPPKPNDELSEEDLDRVAGGSTAIAQQVFLVALGGLGLSPSPSGGHFRARQGSQPPAAIQTRVYNF